MGPALIIEKSSIFVVGVPFPFRPCIKNGSIGKEPPILPTSLATYVAD
ncbi:hypothetical protein SAMN05421852_10153 [Thermoflavimicrobium dichotomicum]|uniref:Uncharacterized protein n=1 Tax=Thermoflavimicrobium dichotomicum TaxID=46223 RepID=A0A1I3JFP3_9BACL|nr:hypothetical protein SAMN05421852_10153 [Thermoflavimicrobium dichotomicum]